MNAAPGRLRALLAGPDIVVMPGAVDPLTARLIEATGFSAVYCTGGGISRSLGFPDVGYITLTEMVDRVRSIAQAVRVPVIADVDSGFGNALTLMRAVRAMEAAGAAGLHVEDKAVPRRLRDPRANLLDIEEMRGRLKAARQARENPDFLLIGRTDALPVLGLEAAIDRANRYADAGADMVYVEYLKTRADMEAVARRVAAPKLISLNKGEGEILPAPVLAAMGYQVLTLPADAQLAAIHAMRAVLAHIRRTGMSDGFDAMVTFPERDELVGLPAARAAEMEYLP
jgi:2-methylisocitrate lyase-like PEP mutase family enzyme